jgi:uncharacterized protein YdhG (YjbR/CyaY superfamily)
MMLAKPQSVDEYLAGFDAGTRKILKQVRAAIKQAAPEAQEVISYGMPAFKWNGMLVWYAGYAKHIGFYPKPEALLAFKKELAVYKSSKGAVQFPIDKPMPLALIKKMVKFRIQANKEAMKLKAVIKSK